MAKELKFYEIAHNTFKEEVKNAILSGEIPVTLSPCKDPYWLARVTFMVGQSECSVSVSDHSVCYHNDLLKGLFDDKEDFKALKAMVEKHVLSEKDKARIKELQAEIDRIQYGKI